jgi:hypothetical protein
MILILLVVEILHLTFFQIRLLEFIVGTIGVGELDPGDHVSHLAAVQGLPFSRFGEFEVSDDKRVTVYLDFQPLT